MPGGFSHCNARSGSVVREVSRRRLCGVHHQRLQALSGRGNPETAAADGSECSGRRPHLGDAGGRVVVVRPPLVVVQLLHRR